MKIELLQNSSDRRWLAETHLRHLHVPPFRSAIIHGNEDCPKMVELFAEREPLVTSFPIAIYAADRDGNLQTA